MLFCNSWPNRPAVCMNDKRSSLDKNEMKCFKILKWKLWSGPSENTADSLKTLFSCNMYVLSCHISANVFGQLL